MLLPVGAQTIKYEGTDASNVKIDLAWRGFDVQKIDTFAKPLVSNKYQNILTAIVGNSQAVSLPNWVVSCLTTPADLKGQINGQGTDLSLPKYAEVAAILLQCKNNGTIANENGYTLSVEGFIQDYEGDAIAETQATYTNMLNELKGNPSVFKSKGAELCTFTKFGGDAFEDFLTSNFSKYFTYTGDNNLLVNVNLTNAKNMEFIYGTFDAVTEKATIFRGLGSYYNGREILPIEPTIVTPTEYYNVDLGGQPVPFPIELHSLPAFGLKYFTNDIRGKILDQDGSPISDTSNPAYQPNGYPLVRLLDVTTGEYICPDGKTLNDKNSFEVEADGSFEFKGLNPADKYQLSMSSNKYGYVEINGVYFDQAKSEADQAAPAPKRAPAFDQATTGKENDIEVNLLFKVPEIHTAVTDVNASKAVAGVKYYNMQGMESAEPFTGVNVVVTTYTDGSKITTKVVK